MKILRILMVFALAILCSCVYMSQDPTPYKRMSGLQGGYWDVHIADDIYMVKFAGNLDTDRQIVKENLVRRAQEVCVENGFSDFEFFSRPPDVLENVMWSKIRCLL